MRLLRCAEKVMSRREAEILLCDLLRASKIDLYTGGVEITAEAEEEFWRMAGQRAGGLPLQHLTGRTEFFGLPIKVAPGVFIPRPETEILVQTVLDLVTMDDGREMRDEEEKWGLSHTWKTMAVGTVPVFPPRDERQGTMDGSHNILDLCTGSGCIAIALAKHLPGAAITAADISGVSLEIAAKNAIINGLSGRITFIQADLFSGIKGRYDLIACNPPYIKTHDIAALPKEVRHDPIEALDGGADGLDFYRRIFKEAPDFLNPGGYLILELGDGQSEGVAKIAKSAGIFKDFEVFNDLNGIKRVFLIAKEIIPA